ncbi:MAG: DUF5522 domain-containing protein [Acidobacteriota bacterium]
MNDNEEERSDNAQEAQGTFVEGRDFYFEDGLMVLTGHYLLDRGYCCENACRHCPYNFVKKTGLE